MSIERLPVGDMVCSYNGYTFGPSAHTTAFSVRPNLDPAGRTVVSATYRIRVEEYLAAATTTDPVVLDAIARLSRNAGKLRYEGRGFGALKINVGGAGSKDDVRWGPHTLSVGCQAVGAGRAVLIAWEAEFTTVNCPDGLTAPGTILLFNFTVGFDVDREGYTTRKYDAVLTIAQTKKSVADKTLAATADTHREKMTPALLVGFRRESQAFNLSQDKNTLTASVVDAQMPPNLPPPGVVDATVEHTYSSQGLARWTGTVSATYTLARREGTPVAALAHFFAVVKDRVAEARKMVTGAGLDIGFKLPKAAEPLAGKPVAIIPVGGSISEPNVLGRTQVRISLSYLAAGVGFAEIIRSGGLWRPTGPNDPAGNWKAWAASIPTVLSPRGHALLTFKPNEDAIVDACVPGAGHPVTFDPTKYRPNGPPPPPAIQSTILSAFPPPRPESSWIEYKTTVTVHPEPGRVTGSTLPGAPLVPVGHPAAGGWDATTGPPAAPPVSGHPFPPLSGLMGGQLPSGGETFVHQRSRPTLYVTIRGQALRAGWDIPIPELVAVNGARPTLVGAPTFTTGVVGNTLVPIVRADWSLTYLFTDEGGTPAGRIPALPNSALA